MLKFIIFLLFISSFAHAKVSVAFIQMRKANGEILQLEPGGHFAHIAMSYEGHWLHVHPYHGVEVVSTQELEKIGQIYTVITLQNMSEPTADQVAQLIGISYDPEFSWDNRRLYCAELIGKILNVMPKPMLFSAPFWQGKYIPMRGQLGLSPDDIYEALVHRGYVPERQPISCSKVLL